MQNKSLRNVLIAMVLAVLVGSWTGTTVGLGGFPFFRLYSLIGTLFLNALSLVVIPLVASSVITGVARIGKEHAVGRLGGKTFGFYALTSLLAVIVGLTWVIVVAPGLSHQNNVAVAALTAPADFGQLASQSEKGPWDRFEEVILTLVPPNIFAAAAQGKILGVIAFSAVFGFILSSLETHLSSLLLSFWQAIFQIMIRMTHLVMKILPLGVFCLVAKVVATTGLDSIRALGLFVAVVVGGLATFIVVVLPLLLWSVGKVNPWLHFRAMAPALATGFSTSSSAATLPTTIDCVEKRAGVSNRICSLVLPLGTSCNMSGSALFQCIASLFIAQVYGYPITFSTVAIVGFIALIFSMGTAGVPSGCLVGVMMILPTLGLPVEGIGLIIAPERLLDMCRTVTNVFSNSCCAVLVARTEGEGPLFYPSVADETVV